MSNAPKIEHVVAYLLQSLQDFGIDVRPAEALKMDGFDLVICSEHEVPDFAIKVLRKRSAAKFSTSNGESKRVYPKRYLRSFGKLSIPLDVICGMHAARNYIRCQNFRNRSNGQLRIIG